MHIARTGVVLRDREEKESAARRKCDWRKEKKD
jgi:hypothetical protein